MIRAIFRGRNPGSRVLPAFSILVALFYFSSCDLFTYKRPFADAYYENNFIAGIGFDSFVGDLDSSAIALDGSGNYITGTGSWDIAYRYDVAWDNFDYITLTDTTNPASFYGAADGLAPASEVYRVEVQNLVSGGDFGADVEPAKWSGTGTAVWDGSSKLFGAGSAKVDLAKGEARMYTSTVTAAAGFPGFSSTVSYNLFFRYYSEDSPAICTLTGDINYQSLAKSTAKNSVNYPINNLTTATPEITFIPNTDLDQDAILENFYLDNIRVGRNGNMELRLFLKITQTDPPLKSGTYSFSVWVHADPDSFDYITPYPVNQFAVKMVPCSGTIKLTCSDATYSTGSGWRKLTATLDKALTFAEDTQLPVLGLVLDFNTTKPGSVLLAQPELRFYPDGL